MSLELKTSGVKSPAEASKSADSVLYDALLIIGFNRNIWSFDPYHVRLLLKWLSLLFDVLTVWSLYTWGGYKWMFLAFGLVLNSLWWYWYSSVECGGGRLIFSRDFIDSFVKSNYTETNYIVNITIGYERFMTASIPFSAFQYLDNGEVDGEWLAVELHHELKDRTEKPKTN